MTIANLKIEYPGTYWEDLQKMLRAVRIACGYSQENVASVLRVNRSTYTNYETGGTNPDTATLITLGKIYQIPPEAFLYPESYTDLTSARKRVRHMPAYDPQKIGELSKEEKQIIAAYRINAKKSVN